MTDVNGFAKMLLVLQTVNPLHELEAFVKQFPTRAAAAKALEIGEPYLHDMLNGNRNISQGILQKLGLEKIVTVVKAV